MENGPRFSRIRDVAATPEFNARVRADSLGGLSAQLPEHLFHIVRARIVRIDLQYLFQMVAG